ncbi:Pumilio domain-containing protein [Gracilariopsis chorda]|uniref:Pumilio domain-containing protein n=1 Tax=Gracilariopsis chorda TaxID=448386 RepID=A0A2V3J355_9FLOR|nr:Pumilio domain-containing protein [Gracilariopsis chorda]|eukprot:PXF48814.1 Pumilio domain-containing protein [Gracilariopsis chorda]
MPDHMLPPPPPSSARPPAYFDPHRPKPADRAASPPASDVLLGVPDRASSASAPPDLEISSRSLFAFKADYSGIFSDIRLDEDYESFYNDNPERTKLPPPLPLNGLPPRPRPRARPSPPLDIQPLRRDDSDASFDDLIFRESSTMRPSSNPSTPTSTSRPTPSRPARTVTTPLPDHSPAALWKLAHLSLDDDQTAQAHAPAPTQPPSAVYQPIPTSPYDLPAPHSPYASYTSPYYQPTHAPGAAAAAAAAAAAVAATHHSSPLPYNPPHSHPQQWSPTHPSRKLAYDLESPVLPSYAAANSHSSDVFPLDPPDDLVLKYASAQTMPYSTPRLSPYRDSAAAAAASPSLFPTSRQVYVSPDPSSPTAPASQSQRSRSANSSANSQSANAYPYGVYAAPSPQLPRHSAYSSSRARVPVDYVNAQAAAAAAAAAAAVYRTNGVHINGPPAAAAALSSLNSRAASLHHRNHNGAVSSRRDARSADVRRSSTNPDSYARSSATSSSSTSSISRSITASHDRAAPRTNAVSDTTATASNSSIKLSSFNDVVGRAEELARDQHGCRFLQTKLEEGNALYINSIFEECYDKFVELMMDPFGNYLCQKLFEFCNDAQRLALVERCAPAVASVSTNMHGTRAVQRMVECLSTPEQVDAVCKALTPAAVALMKDINGNHVIQRCLNRMDPAHNQFVYDAVAANCFELATHRHGCCVMQRCMDYASPAQRNQLAQQINANALPLVQNAFGNYVVQYVLELNDPVYTAEIIRRLRGHVAELSMQKFSSNVVEKGLQRGDRETKRQLIDELIENEDTMKRLLHDAYGNYVIQRALQVAEGAQLERICEAIRPHLPSLKQSPYGKRIQAKIMKRMPKGVVALPQ